MAHARNTENLNADTAVIDNLPSDLEAVLDEATPAGPSGENPTGSLCITSGFDRTAPVTASWFTLPAPRPAVDSEPSFLRGLSSR